MKSNAVVEDRWECTRARPRCRPQYCGLRGKPVMLERAIDLGRKEKVASAMVSACTLTATPRPRWGSTRLGVELEGQPRKIALAYLNVWVKRDGRWQLVARQSAFKPVPK